MSKAVAVATGDEEEEEGCRLWAVAVEISDLEEEEEEEGCRMSNNV